jgi:quercetin dioxygenase-like cupin family protein
MAEFYRSDSLDWTPVRPDVARGVLGQVLVDGPIKAILTRVSAGGRFASHCDPYGHLFFVIEGAGRVHAGATEQLLAPGDIVRIAPGEPHGYENTGECDLVLMSFNLPAGP